MKVTTRLECISVSRIGLDVDCKFRDEAPNYYNCLEVCDPPNLI